MKSLLSKFARRVLPMRKEVPEVRDPMRTNGRKVGGGGIVTSHEEERAWSVFQEELASTRNPRTALHAAFVDFEARAIPKDHAQLERFATTEKRPRPLLEANRAMIESICSFLEVDVEAVCAGGWASRKVATARGVIVGILSDRGFLARAISDGTGIGMAVVQNCRAFRPKRPSWGPLIARFGGSADRGERAA
jgi:hypothetical protein